MHMVAAAKNVGAWYVMLCLIDCQVWVLLGGILVVSGTALGPLIEFFRHLTQLHPST